ncbi:MAG: YjjG family noncanonical pyrimidine nucleotidase [Oscillospiraceae bacterium]|nr:YjjG family noncanonical pyrimidine nucleotidase [Oscillospiraceae bacterium]
MTKAVLWDLDGTLLNFKASERAAIRACFAFFGLGECTDRMIADYSAINLRWWEALERGEYSREEILVGRYREFLTLYGLDPGLAEAFTREYEHRLPDTIAFEPGALETVKALRGRVGQYAVTNGTKNVQRPKLRRSGLDDLLDGVFISEEIGAEKPSLRFFEKVLEALGDVSPGELLIVGDSLTSDIRGGNNARIPTVWYNPEGKPRPAQPHADYEIRSIGELPGLLQI